MRDPLVRLVAFLLAFALVFANVASAAMRSAGDAPVSSHHAHCHAATSAAKHTCGDPRAACCAFACDCAPSADLAVAFLVAPVGAPVSREFPPSTSRFAASIEPRPLRPPIA